MRDFVNRLRRLAGRGETFAGFLQEKRRQARPRGAGIKPRVAQNQFFAGDTTGEIEKQAFLGVPAPFEREVGAEFLPGFVKKQRVFPDEPRKTLFDHAEQDNKIKTQTAGAHHVANKDAAAPEFLRLIRCGVECALAKFGKGVERDRRFDGIKFGKRLNRAGHGRMLTTKLPVGYQRGFDHDRPRRTRRQGCAGDHDAPDKIGKSAGWQTRFPLGFAANNAEAHRFHVPLRMRAKMTGEFEHGGTTEVGTDGIKEELE